MVYRLTAKIRLINGYNSWRLGKAIFPLVIIVLFFVRWLACVCIAHHPGRATSQRSWCASSARGTNSMKEETLDGLRNLAEAKEQRWIDSPEYNALKSCWSRGRSRAGAASSTRGTPARLAAGRPAASSSMGAPRHPPYNARYSVLRVTARGAPHRRPASR